MIQKYPANTEGFRSIGDAVKEQYGVSNPVGFVLDRLSRGKKR